MRGVFVSSLIFVWISLSHAEKCGPPVSYAPNATANDNCYSIAIFNSPVSPDGVPRKAITVDGLMPGTLLTANKGEDIYTQVNNKLGDKSMLLPTSIHWHGIRQPRTAFDDGPSFVTQCPLIPGRSYTYKIEAADQTGTYWYHSHYSSQYVDGLRAPLVIYDRKVEPSKFGYDADLAADNENTIISLTDWYHLNSQEVIRLPSQTADSGLLNGKGLYRKPGTTTTTGQRAVINVVKGKKYRLRIINMSAAATFTFGIQHHSFTVFEVDGINHNYTSTRQEVSSLTISAGQRYSIVLNANQDVNNYWIAYPPATGGRHNDVGAYAVLHYQNAAPAPITGPDPDFQPILANALEEWRLIPLETLGIPNTTTLPLKFQFKIKDGKWFLNQFLNTTDFTYKSPSVPTLLEILTSNNGNQSAGFDESVIVLPKNIPVEVSLQGGAGHLPSRAFNLAQHHGHHFEVVQSATGPRNDINPPIRDTVSTNGAVYNPTSGPGSVTIRFPTNNPGPWFLHCHIDWHLENGLALVFAEDPEDQRLQIKPLKEWCGVCRDYDTYTNQTDSTRFCNQLGA